ncbi:MAG: RNA methyltransferase [Bdellovibrionota bacterium]
MNSKNSELRTSRPIDLRVVLVRPIYERNVGACSRAMSNMGYHRMILIQPQCELTIEAQKAAATGQHALQNRIVYQSWDEFFKNEPDSLRISTSARDGRGRLSRDLSEALQELSQNSPQLKEKTSKPLVVHLFFGPEDWGLSADDLKYSHLCCSIPTYGDNTSLNLAQAVLLSLFILRQNWGGEKAKLDGQVKNRRAVEGESVFPDETLKTWLSEMGFDLSKPKMNAHTVLRRLLLQNTPTRKELNILEIVLQQSLRKLRLYNKLNSNLKMKSRSSDAPKKRL